MLPLPFLLLRHMVDGLPTPPVMGGRGLDGAETEIDQEDSQDPSHLAGLEESPLDEAPGTLKRKLQFDAAECGLTSGDEDLGFLRSWGDLVGEEIIPNHDKEDTMDVEDTDLFGLPQAETQETHEGSFVVPIPGFPVDPVDVEESEMFDEQLDDEIEKSSQMMESKPKEDEQQEDEQQQDDSQSKEDQKKQFKTSEKQRENSRNWHKKWISKGVPREDQSKKVPKPVPKSMITKKEKSKEKLGKPATSSSSSLSSKPAKNLAQAKDFFITKWIEGCGMDPSNDRRTAAINAWMNSSERSDFIAGQKGSQK